MNRRIFIRQCSIACTGTLLLPFIQGCNSISHIAVSSTESNRIKLSKKSFLTGKSNKPLKDYVITQSEKFTFPICIYRLENNAYAALLMECSHNSCELQVQGSYLQCPCHGSEFNNQGQVQNPPAELPLKTFNVTQDEEFIYILL
jgi:cytochrome b6-f complex iron-sulfur subunit